MNTYAFEPRFTAGTNPGHLGSYVIPWGESGLHDEARLNAVLGAHPGMDVTWDASAEGPNVGLHGAGAQIEPCRLFAYTDADLLILGAELVAQEAAAKRGLGPA